MEIGCVALGKLKSKFEVWDDTITNADRHNLILFHAVLSVYIFGRRCGVN